MGKPLGVSTRRQYKLSSCIAVDYLYTAAKELKSNIQRRATQHIFMKTSYGLYLVKCVSSNATESLFQSSITVQGVMKHTLNL